MKKVTQVVFPFFMTMISMFQPASIQIYLGCTAILSAITGTILRSPGFRKWSGLAPLPTPEAQALWKRVAKGEIPLSRVVGKDGRILPITARDLGPSYQAPGKTGTSQVRGINMRKSAVVPLHIQKKVEVVEPALKDRDHDYDNPPQGLWNMDKIDWFGRNYNPQFVYRRMRNYIKDVSNSTPVQSEVERITRQRKEKAAAKEKAAYEARRRERFGQR